MLVVVLAEASDDDPQDAIESETTANAISFVFVRGIVSRFVGLWVQNIFIFSKSFFYSLLKASIGERRAPLLAG